MSDQDTWFLRMPKRSKHTDGYVVDRDPGATTPVLWDKVEALEKQVEKLAKQLADLSHFVHVMNQTREQTIVEFLK